MSIIIFINKYATFNVSLSFTKNDSHRKLILLKSIILRTIPERMIYHEVKFLRPHFGVD